MATQIDDRLLNVGQAAGYIGVSAASLRKWSDAGQIAVYRTPGGQRRFQRGDLDRFIHSMRQDVGIGNARPAPGAALRN